jgi:hypothetical protein
VNAAVKVGRGVLVGVGLPHERRTSSGEKTSIAVERRWRGFSTSAIGLTGSRWARRVRVMMPLRTVSSLTLVRLLIRSVPFHASMRSVATSSIRSEPNAGSRCVRITER